MRSLLMLLMTLVAGMVPVASALAHFGLSGDDDIGHGLFWIYGILLTGIAAFIIYRKWIGSSVSPQQRTLTRRLSELERAHTACMARLKNAEDYPNECGLTPAQRQERLDSVALIQQQICETKAELAAA